MAKNFKYGIAATVIAVTIATTGITTVSSFTFVPEAQAWSIKSAVKKTVKGAKRVGKTVRGTARAIDRKVVPSEIRNARTRVKNTAKKIVKWRPKPGTITNTNSHDHRTKSFSKVTVKRR